MPLSLHLLPILSSLLLAGAEAGGPDAGPAQTAQVVESRPKGLPDLDAAARAALPLPALEAALRAASVDELIATARAAVASLGTYSVTVTKQESVGGDLVGPQVIALTVRPKPFAALMRFQEGPGKGRVVFFDETLRKHDLRAREPGLKGLFGALWIDIDSSLTRSESNHPVTDNGFARLLDFLASDLERGKAAGGHARADEPATAGKWCSVFSAPAGAKGLRGDVTRICFDPVTALPLLVEVTAKGALLERYTYQAVKPRLTEAEAGLTLEAAGL
jgi:hypothetical protein